MSRRVERAVLYVLAWAFLIAAGSSILWMAPLLNHFFETGDWGVVGFLVGGPILAGVGLLFLRAYGRLS